MIILDSCVLIALTDARNVFHCDAKRILTTTESLAITALSGAEVMVDSASHPQVNWRDLLFDLDIDVVDIAEGDMEAIAKMRRISGMKMPDALVLWLAEAHGAAIATFDRQLLNKAQALGIRTIH